MKLFYLGKKVQSNLLFSLHFYLYKEELLWVSGSAELPTVQADVPVG
jgi:hypothetical protein